MKPAAVVAVLALLVPTTSSAAGGDPISPATGKPAAGGTDHTMRSTSMPPASAATASIAAAAATPGGLYGTDGLNLYTINKATGAANLIGSHNLPSNETAASCSGRRNEGTHPCTGNAQCGNGTCS